MVIRVLGPGCANCETLYELTRKAAGELGVESDVEKVTDMLQIAIAGIMSTPGLVINRKVKHSGKPLPSLEKVKELIKEEM